MSGITSSKVKNIRAPLSRAVEINPRLVRDTIKDDLDVSFVPMAAIEAETGQIDLTTIRKFSEVKKGYTSFRDGDILFAKITPCMENGKMAVARGLKNGIGFGSTEFHVLRPRDQVDPNYVYRIVSSASFRNTAAHQMTGAVGQKRVPAAFLEQCEIPLPPLDSQRRIVAEIEKQFSRLDQGVAGLRRAQQNLKRYKAAVLKAAVTGQLTAAWRQAHPNGEPASAMLERILTQRRQTWQGRGKYKEPAKPDTSGLPDLPAGWVWTTVEQLAEVGTGATPLKSNSRYYKGGTIPWVTSSALNSEFIRQAEDFITESALSETNAKLFPIHTLLVAMYGEGKTRGKVSELLIEAATNQACAAIIFGAEAEKIRPFVKLFFLNNYEVIRRLSSGGVQPNLNLSHIKTTRIPLPPLPEQTQIVAEVEKHLSAIAALETAAATNLTRATHLRQAVLSGMFEE